MKQQSLNKIILEPTIPEVAFNVEEIYSTYSYFYSKDYSFKGESHEAWELIYINRGEVIIETPEYEKILSREQIFIHTPNEFHKIKANNTSCNIYFISFKCKCNKLYEIAQKPIHIPHTLKNYLISILGEGEIFLAGKNNIPIIKNKKPGFASGQIIKNFIEILLIELMRLNSYDSNEKMLESDVTNTEKSLANYIINYLKENIQTKIKLETIAKAVGYSVSHICYVFKKTIKVSVINYLIKLRIEKAKELMAEGKMTLCQISEYLDFDSIQYFSSQFKKITNITPSQYINYLKLKKFQYDNAENLHFL